MAFEKPASSKAGCHASIPFTTQGTSHSGVARSTQYSMGLTGSESSAFGILLLEAVPANEAALCRPGARSRSRRR
jgi:hypothetical protein